MDLAAAVKAHRSRREKDKNAILTMVIHLEHPPVKSLDRTCCPQTLLITRAALPCHAWHALSLHTAHTLVLHAVCQDFTDLH